MRINRRRNLGSRITSIIAARYQRFHMKKSGLFLLQPCKGKCVLEPSNSKWVPEPSYSKCIPEPSNSKCIPEPPNSKGILEPSNSKRILEPSNSKRIPEPPNSKCILELSNSKNVPEPSNSNIDQMDVDQATTINFQDEIIVEFLSRLPVRSLLQFKCVSNFWYTLISDPYFQKMHLKRAKSDRNFQKFLICKWEGKYSCYCCPLSSDQSVKEAQKLARPLSSKRYFRLHCSFDGLVIASVTDTRDGSRPILLLWNPSTNESIELPSVELQRQGVDRFGLGYDSTSKEYKMLKSSLIITTTTEEVHCEFTIEILTLKGGSWRKIDKHPGGLRNVLDYSHDLAFVHNAFHWTAKSKTFSLVSFSISNEVYGEVPLPEEASRLVNVTLGVSVLDGMLCVHSQEITSETFKLWIMKEYGVKDSWTALFTMEDPSAHIAVPKYRFPDGEVIIGCIGNAGYAFRTPSGPFKHWPEVGSHYGLAYTESLISPKSLICFRGNNPVHKAFRDLADCYHTSPVYQPQHFGF